MLNIHQISHSFGLDIILDQITFSVKANQRLGLVGPNGCGKTTLLRIITGEIQPDRGVVQRVPVDLRVGYLQQGQAQAGDISIQDFLNEGRPPVEDLYQRLENIGRLLAMAPEDRQLIEEYDTLLQVASQNSASTASLQEVLGRLNLDGFAPEAPLSILSGGQKTRLALARILLSHPQLLILDEPTNHLDVAMIEWLEKWILDFQGPVLVVSHDRRFLDTVATGILELSPLTHQVKQYAGGYSAYLTEKQAEQERQWQEYVDQLDEIARLRGAAAHMRDIARFHKGGKADTGDKFARGFFANRGLETTRRAKAIEARVEHLLNEDKIDKPGRTWALKIDFQEPHNASRKVLSITAGAIGYPGVVVKQEINFTVQFGERIILLGPNGCGKSTLLRTIGGKIPLLAGELVLGNQVNIGFMEQEQEDLPPEQNALEIIAAETPWNETETRAFLHKFLFAADDVFRPVKMMSYGERARLSLALLVARGCNLLLLDEPINHLDITSRSRFEDALLSYEGAIIAVAHDRYFIDKIATQLWEFSDAGITRVH